jgi:O-antigen/teichoic acid export membrane protein
MVRYRSQVLRATEPAPGWLGLWDRSYFVRPLPLFLLGFSGMLQSRVDLYCVSLFLSREEVGHYQVFINLMTYIQSISYFVLAPFLRSFYRLRHEAASKIGLRLFAFGLVIIGPALLAAQLILVHLYRFEFSPWYLIVGGLFAVPVYLYLPFVYTLYRANEEETVLHLNVLGIAISFALSLALLPTLGMLGGVIASATAQWAMLAAYLWRSRPRMGRSALSQLP